MSAGTGHLAGVAAIAVVACAATTPDVVSPPSFFPVVDLEDDTKAEVRDGGVAGPEAGIRPYFEALKSAVAAKWDIRAAFAARDPTGRIFGRDKPLTTVLAVTLDATGALKEVSVHTSSGLDFVDASAVDAFRQAQPFGPPPARLVEKTKNELRFTFGFHVEPARRPIRQLPRP